MNNNRIKNLTFPLIALSLFILMSCNKNKDDKGNGQNSSCYVHLYDGDNFEDDNIIVKGPGEFNDLKNLPNADKDWNDEADALKVGSQAKVTVWTEENFEGESTIFEANTEEPNLHVEIRSMKISCN